MLLDNFDISELSEDKMAAFAEFEAHVRRQFEQRARDDKDHNSDQHGNYSGSYEPERSYVTNVLAFLDEYDLETDIEDISALDNPEFNTQFGRFKSKIEYISTRYALRRGRVAAGSLGTAISFVKAYKSEIGAHLEKIRKIVNQEVPEGNKKDKIFGKISSLQSEVDRDQTTVDAAFGRALDLSKLLGEAGGSIKPAVDQLERIKKIFWENSDKVDSLPRPERPKMIPKDNNSPNREMDDEIPF